MEKGQSFQSIVLRKLDILKEKMKLDPYLILYTYINLKWIKELNVRFQLLILEESREEKLQDSGLGNGLLDMTSKPQVTKEKIDKLDFAKIETDIMSYVRYISIKAPFVDQRTHSKGHPWNGRKYLQII